MLLLFTIPSFMVGFLIGYFKLKSKYNKILTKGTGRYGIINKYDFFLEIEEIESAGLFTKVRLVNLVDRMRHQKVDKNVLLLRCEFNEWVKTQDITWFESNSQLNRDRKIKEIIGEG